MKGEGGGCDTRAQGIGYKCVTEGGGAIKKYQKIFDVIYEWSLRLRFVFKQKLNPKLLNSKRCSNNKTVCNFYICLNKVVRDNNRLTF